MYPFSLLFKINSYSYLLYIEIYLTFNLKRSTKNNKITIEFIDTSSIIHKQLSLLKDNIAVSNVVKPINELLKLKNEHELKDQFRRDTIHHAHCKLHNSALERPYILQILSITLPA